MIFLYKALYYNFCMCIRNELKKENGSPWYFLIKTLAWNWGALFDKKQMFVKTGRGCTPLSDWSLGPNWSFRPDPAETAAKSSPVWLRSSEEQDRWCQQIAGSQLLSIWSYWEAEKAFRSSCNIARIHRGFCFFLCDDFTL